MQCKTWCRRVARLSWRLVLGGLLGAGLLACSEPVDPSFIQTFIDVNKRGDDSASTAQFDAQLGVLAVGRESGRVEIWSTRESGRRIAVQGHPARPEFLAFGHDDGTVLSASRFDNHAIDPSSGVRIWDATTGELRATVSGLWAPGPLAALPQKHLFLISDTSDLLLYDFAQRKGVGTRLSLKTSLITALAVNATNGLIAVGGGDGKVFTLRLVVGKDEVPRLEVIKQADPYNSAPRSDVLDLAWFDDDRRLVAANRIPEGAGRDVLGEVVEWDPQELKPLRRFPISLQTLNWASHTPGEPWMVLAGTESTRGRIELVDLRNGVAWRYKANTERSRAVLLPDVREGLILQSGGATRIAYLDQE